MTELQTVYVLFFMMFTVMAVFVAVCVVRAEKHVQRLNTLYEFVKDKDPYVGEWLECGTRHYGSSFVTCYDGSATISSGDAVTWTTTYDNKMTGEPVEVTENEEMVYSWRKFRGGELKDHVDGNTKIGNAWVKDDRIFYYDGVYDYEREEMVEAVTKKLKKDKKKG